MFKYKPRQICILTMFRIYPFFPSSIKPVIKTKMSHLYPGRILPRLYLYV
jgi:hypothetical protein